MSSSPSVWRRILIESPRIAFDTTMSTFMENLPSALAALGIGAAGLVVGYFFFKLAEWISGAESEKRWERDTDQAKYVETRRHVARNTARIICMVLAIIAITMGFWIGSSTAGVNFWTIILAYGILSMLAGHAFGASLTNGGAFFVLTLTYKFNRGTYIEMTGQGAEGRIVAIHALWVELEFWDQEATDWVEYYVPTYMLLMSVVKRPFAKEKNMRKRPPLNPNTAAHVFLPPQRRLKRV